AIISGSLALHMVFPANSCAWTPSDLDIYNAKACLSHFHHALTFSECHLAGYNIIYETHIDGSPYNMSAIRSILTFSNRTHYIDAIVSRMSTALSPLFQFHSTAVMNFISADTIFCAYPNLMFNHCALIN
ncbi:hypothetical protein M404DRAFT_73173, partial [Pisolithus tinctorius Marx 270]